MSSVFTSLINDGTSERILFKNDHFVAILEDKPLVLGHTVIVPRREEDDVFDLSADELGQMMVFSKSVAAAIKKVVPCEKIGIAAIGLVVRHAHLHLVPISTADDLNFTRQKLSPSDVEISVMAERIRQSL